MQKGSHVLPATEFIYWKRFRNLAFLEKTGLLIAILFMRVGIGIKKIQLSTLMRV